METVEEGTAAKEAAPPLKPALDVYRQIKGLNFIYNEKEDADRFDVLCKYILNRFVSEGNNASSAYRYGRCVILICVLHWD